MSSSVEVRRLTTPQELFEAAAEEVVQNAKQSVEERGRFTLALSGGSTPRSLYALLANNARSSLPWDRTFFFWSDERHVPPTDPDSNSRMAQESMLSKASVPTGNILRVPAEMEDAAAVATSYEQTIRKFFAVEAGQFPRFDMILLGMGPDGHTAWPGPRRRRLFRHAAAPRFLAAGHRADGPCSADLRRRGPRRRRH